MRRLRFPFDYGTGRITIFLCSVQHSSNVEVSDFRHIIEGIMVLAVTEYALNTGVVKMINPTGHFVIGGSFVDCGVTGRKLVCDTYGDIDRIGGGTMSGKDLSKVDRSSAYMVRKAIFFWIHSITRKSIVYDLTYRYEYFMYNISVKLKKCEL